MSVICLEGNAGLRVRVPQNVWFLMVKQWLQDKLCCLYRGDYHHYGILSNYFDIGNWGLSLSHDYISSSSSSSSINWKNPWNILHSCGVYPMENLFMLESTHVYYMYYIIVAWWWYATKNPYLSLPWSVGRTRLSNRGQWSLRCCWAVPRRWQRQGPSADGCWVLSAQKAHDHHGFNEFLWGWQFFRVDG